MNRILILGPDSASNQRLTQLTAAEGYSADVLDERKAVTREILLRQDMVAILCDGEWALDLLPHQRHCPLIVLDRNPQCVVAVAAMKAGAADYLPLSEPEALGRALGEHVTRNHRHQLQIIGNSPPMQKLIGNIDKVAPTDSPVMICGESGTGKELVARAVHAASHRRIAPMISVNCATIPEHHIEAELFGLDSSHGPQHGGLLNTATGGTLFLDEIGELPKSAQARLLRELEQGIDVRLITATHRDLADLVQAGQFRDDLYYRLNVVTLKIPPLRHRGEDVLLLAEAALRRTLLRLRKPELSFTEDARRCLTSYRWPGNVRELENAIERAVILSDGELIQADLLAIETHTPERTDTVPTAPDQTIEDYFVSFVTSHQDQMTETEIAEKLGISRKSLWERRQRLNIPRKKTPKRGRRRDIS